MIVIARKLHVNNEELFQAIKAANCVLEPGKKKHNSLASFCHSLLIIIYNQAVTCRAKFSENSQLPQTKKFKKKSRNGLETVSI